MKTHFYSKCFLVAVVMFFVTIRLFPQPTITGPAGPGMPEYVSGGLTTDAVYYTETGQTGYDWKVSGAGTITDGGGTFSIKVTWNNPTGQQWISVNYDGTTGPTVLLLTYYPYLNSIDPLSVPKFVDPLPHFAAGLRVNAKKGGTLLVKAVEVQQVALSTGTHVDNGIIGDPATPNAGKGNYEAYAISKDGGKTFGPAMWPGQTVEAQQGYPLKFQYRNDLVGVTYADFNILADQTLMKSGYPLNGDPLADPYTGPIPMVAHLHGGEIPSNSDGGPTAWFMPGYSLLGPGFQFNASSLCTYPNTQEAATLWFHPHDDGLTRINVYTGLAAFYFLRGKNEEVAKLPGWSGDDLVREVTPAGKTATFNGTNSYLPEIEIAIQDRMFNTKGELYWPVNPTNPDMHPYWTPEFVGDCFVVNGKSWPYLSVAPRKYRFRFLEGCNARMLNMWLENTSGNVAPAPKFNVIGCEGGLLATPQTIDYLFMAPGQRYDVVIDFTGVPDGTVFTLRNNAQAPFPTGDLVIPGATDQIMQFIVNGQMVSARNTALAGTDKSKLPTNLRPVNPLVQLTDFAGNLNVTPTVHRQLILNEVTGAGGPATVQVNNTYFEAELGILGSPQIAGGPTEFQREGTTELVEIINTTTDAHPMHIHLLQWQLVKRQNIDRDAFMAKYCSDWAANYPNLGEFPAGLGYPGGAGTPWDYNRVNEDGAIGGNPAAYSFLKDVATPPNPEEKGWKDNVVVQPNQMTTFLVRVAPTDKPINATQKQLMFSFDPSLGPGYVVHCHIVDHEDMSMMRGLVILPSPQRFPKIILQPSDQTTCKGFPTAFLVLATSDTKISYQWQVSKDNGGTWTNLTNGAPYFGVKSMLLGISSTPLTFNNYQYQCVLTNIDGSTVSKTAILTVKDCSKTTATATQTVATSTAASSAVTVDGNTVVPVQMSAYPNPASTSTTVSYTLPEDGSVSIGIFNSSGTQLKSLVNQNQTAGTYNVTVALSSLLGGTYYIQLTFNGVSGQQIKAITLIKN